MFATAMPLLVNRSSGSSTRLPTMVVWLSAAITDAPSCWRWLAFGADAFRPSTSADGLVAGGLDGVGGPVVLAGLPDDRIPVVLPCVVDGHADAEGQGGHRLTRTPRPHAAAPRRTRYSAQPRHERGAPSGQRRARRHSAPPRQPAAPRR